MAMVIASIVLAVMLDAPRLEAQTPNLRDPISCDQSAIISGNTAATVQLVGLTATQRIRVCGFVLTGGGATTAKFVRGTGTNCGSGTADLTAAFELGDNTVVAYGGGAGVIFQSALGEALCWTNSGAVQVSGQLTFAKF